MEASVTRRTLIASALTVLTALAAAPAAIAHPGHAHKIMGTITMVREGRVEVADANKEKTIFAITKETKILVGKSAGSQSDLQTGLRIVVEAEEEEGEKFVAIKIQLPAKAAK